MSLVSAKYLAPVGLVTLDKQGEALQFDVKEHQWYLRLGEEEKSVLASHEWAMGHSILLKETKKQFQFASWGLWVVRESLEIYLAEEVLNQEYSLKLSSAWLPA